jgi:hypothetical protein
MTPLCDRNTAAWRLFHLPYDTMVPQLSQYSVEYLRKNPIQSTGNRQVDRLRQNIMVPAKHTTAGLAMLYNEGHAFSLMHYQDCVQIYSDIQRHFMDWRDQVYQGAEPSWFPPIEELRMFEQIAIEVHDLAKKLEPKNVTTSAVFESIMAMNRRRNLVGTNKFIRERNTTNGQLNPYQSIVDAIEAYVVEG